MKTRIAPSPSGSLHIGGAKMALACWLWARNQHGEFVVRIEDTDKNRSSEAFADSILEDLRFLNIDWDQGPLLPGGELYYQSNRMHIYNKFAKQLIKDGVAYPCFCGRERVRGLKEDQLSHKMPPKYDGKCRSISPSQAKKFMRNHPFTIRIKNDFRKIELNDLVFGKIKFHGKNYDDFIIVRDCGTPMYNFACVVDDHVMGITHVMRGCEHLQNTSKQIMIYNALQVPIPQFAHSNVIMDPKTKRKMSKRDQGASIKSCREMGIGKDALIMYLSTLGVGVKNIKKPSIRKMIKNFNVKNLKKSPVFHNVSRMMEINNKLCRRK